jgi:hypothetical protein
VDSDTAPVPLILGRIQGRPNQHITAGPIAAEKELGSGPTGRQGKEGWLWMAGSAAGPVDAAQPGRWMWGLALPSGWPARRAAACGRPMEMART